MLCYRASDPYRIETTGFIGDFNLGKRVDMLDLEYLISLWLSDVPIASGPDLSGDGTINLNDL